MENNFIGKNALITGASSGIGKDIAYVMAEKGINIALLARREDALNKIKEDLESKYSVRVMIILADLSQTFEYEKNLFLVLFYFPLSVYILFRKEN